MKKLEILEERYLNPLTDFGFHRIFGPESNKKFLIDFLNQIIREEGLITEIQYLPSEQWGIYERERKAVFDIFCTTEKDEYFIVEMQNAKQAHFRDRSLFYASLPIQKQAPKGIWDFGLKPVYMVAIMDFILFKDFKEDEEHVVERVQLVRENTKTIYSNKLKFAFVELPKFKKKEKELETNFDKWLYVLKNLSKLKNRPASVQGKIFEELFELAEIKRLTEEDMETYKKSVLEYDDVRSAMNCAREEGREEGHEEGREKSLEKVIQKSLQMNIPIEVIVEITGYSKEQIISYK